MKNQLKIRVKKLQKFVIVKQDQKQLKGGWIGIQDFIDT